VQGAEGVELQCRVLREWSCDAGC